MLCCSVGGWAESWLWMACGLWRVGESLTLCRHSIHTNCGLLDSEKNDNSNTNPHAPPDFVIHTDNHCQYRNNKQSKPTLILTLDFDFEAMPFAVVLWAYSCWVVLGVYFATWSSITICCTSLQRPNVLQALWSFRSWWLAPARLSRPTRRPAFPKRCGRLWTRTARRWSGPWSSNSEFGIA